MLKKILHTTSLKANIIANFTGNGIIALTSLLFIPVYLKYIGAEGYGLIGIFASLQVVLSLLDSGLSTILNKELARMSAIPGTAQRMRNMVKTLGSMYWLAAIAAGLIALALSPLLAKYWVNPKELSPQTVTYAFMLLSISVTFQFVNGFYSGGMLGLQRQVMLNTQKIIFTLLKSFGAWIILATVSRSVIVFFSWNLLITALQAMVARYTVWLYLPEKLTKDIFDKQEIKEVWRFAAGMMGISLTAIFLTQVDKIILSKILSLEAFGYYTIACTLGLMIFQVSAPITQSYFPKFSAANGLNHLEELRKIYHQGCQMISVIVVPVTATLIFFSKNLIFIWTNNIMVTENTWIITAVYAYGSGLNAYMSLPYLLTLSHNWTKMGLYQNLVFLLLFIPVTIFLAIQYGAVGGALAWAGINTLYFFVTPNLIHRKLLKGEVSTWYWNDTLKPLIAGVAVVGLSKYFFTHGSTHLYNLAYIAVTALLSLLVTMLFATRISNIFVPLIRKLF
ncbi:MAG: oligosaccharide flippase family protein [Rhizobacter sp.]|nr:oligosaccharide flippase family protein [Ferruginibacter sp.]